MYVKTGTKVRIQSVQQLTHEAHTCFDEVGRHCSGGVRRGSDKVNEVEWLFLRHQQAGPRHPHLAVYLGQIFIHLIPDTDTVWMKEKVILFYWTNSLGYELYFSLGVYNSQRHNKKQK